MVLLDFWSAVMVTCRVWHLRACFAPDLVKYPDSTTSPLLIFTRGLKEMMDTARLDAKFGVEQMYLVRNQLVHTAHSAVPTYVMAALWWRLESLLGNLLGAVIIEMLPEQE